jgi:hypothetical protein
VNFFLAETDKFPRRANPVTFSTGNDMSNFTRLTALAFATLVSAISFGSGAADAAACDGGWARDGRRLEKQCYYLPTVSTGRVTGVQLEQNYRQYQPEAHPGAVIGGAIPHGGYYGPPGGNHHGGGKK